MVDNETMEGPLLLPTIKGGDYGQGQEGEGSGPTMDKGLPTQKPIMILFRRSPNWNESWQLQGPLWKNTRPRLNS
jgi:hypothetical protein